MKHEKEENILRNEIVVRQRRRRTDKEREGEGKYLFSGEKKKKRRKIIGQWRKMKTS